MWTIFTPHLLFFPSHLLLIFKHFSHQDYYSIALFINFVTFFPSHLLFHLISYSIAESIEADKGVAKNHSTLRYFLQSQELHTFDKVCERGPLFLKARILLLCLFLLPTFTLFTNYKPE